MKKCKKLKLEKIIWEQVICDVQELIKIGKVNYAEYLKQQEQRIEKSREFIRNAIKITDTIETSEGFIVKSKSNNEYFIEIHTPHRRGVFFEI